MSDDDVSNVISDEDVRRYIKLRDEFDEKKKVLDIHAPSTLILGPVMAGFVAHQVNNVLGIAVGIGTFLYAGRFYVNEYRAKKELERQLSVFEARIEARENYFRKK